MSRVGHGTAVGIAVLAAVLNVAPAAPEPLSKGDIKMPLMPEDRNSLVVYGEDPEAPPAPTLGVAIRFAAEGEMRVATGEPAVLHGVFRADPAILRGSAGLAKSAVFLTVLRVDKPFGQTTPLFTPTVRPAPPMGGMDVGPDYREGATFRVDLAKFFSLPAEPGRYTVQACLGGHFSDRLEFSIVAH